MEDSDEDIETTAVSLASYRKPRNGKLTLLIRGGRLMKRLVKDINSRVYYLIWLLYTDRLKHGQVQGTSVMHT